MDLAADGALVARWPLTGDCEDHSGGGHHGRNHHAIFTPDGARFDGRESVIDVAHCDALAFGAGDFAISAWVDTDDALDSPPGAILGKFDHSTRTGVNLSLMTHAGVSNSQTNYRNVHFGIDAGRCDDAWTDCGRPGTSIFNMAMAVHRGDLYVGTVEWCQHEAGHVYRRVEDGHWEDCGCPDRCNAVAALAEWNGHLYAGASHYLTEDSSVIPSPNENPGGRVYRYEGGKEWTYCGTLANPETGEAWNIGGMSVFAGSLYATPLKQDGRGLYRYEGGTEWAYCGHPGYRVLNPFPFHGGLHCVSYDLPHVFRYDLDGSWTDCGESIEVAQGQGQTYAFTVYEGQMHLSSWPLGVVYAYEGDGRWVGRGRPMDEKESMALMVYNGTLYTGALPSSRVYRMEDGERWEPVGQQLDTGPGIYRRAWTMTVFRGRLYCGTLPSGRVLSIEAGRNATYDHALPSGPRHLAAIRDGSRLRLYVDGAEVATSDTFTASDYDLANSLPLRIGAGASGHFQGRLRDLRIYRRALAPHEVSALASGA